jgi:hypothetical protein
MASKTIEHPLRTIRLTYNEATPFHPFEEAMLLRYTTLHNFVKELCEEYNNIQQRYQQHDINIRRVIARFRGIKTRMVHLTEGARNVLNAMVPAPDQVEKVVAEGKEFKALLASFNREVEKLAAESNLMHQIFTPLDTKDELLSEIFREYKSYRGELAGNHAVCSLDFEQYDTDEQAFMRSLNNMSGKQTEFIEVCNTVIDRYNLFVEEVEKTFEQWEKCNDMLEMVQLIAVRPNDISMICLN